MDITYFDEYIDINGIKEYIIYFPKEGSDVVLLHLHGGPGGADSLNCFYFLPNYLNCNMVFYDQRGAGKTNLASPANEKTVSLETLLSDLEETIACIKAKFNTQKIVLLGHSFGSILGHLFVKKHPDDVAGFIAVGQVVNILKGEKQSFELLKPKILSSGLEKDKQLINELYKLNYPYLEEKSNWDHYLRAFRHLESVYFPTYSDSPSLYTIIFRTPNFKVKDLKWLSKKGIKKTMKLNANLTKEALYFDIGSNRSYDVPYFAIVGAEDHITPASLTKEYFEEIKAPLKSYFEIPSSGHSPFSDNTKEFYNVINVILFKIFNEPRSEE